MLKKNKRTPLFFIFLIIPTFACQFLDEIFLESSNVVNVPPTVAEPSKITSSENDNLDENENPNIIPTSTLAEPSSPELTPEQNVAESSTETPEPDVTDNASSNDGGEVSLPTTLVQPEGLENFAGYESRIGYGFYHPNNWIVAEYFGQAIVTNDPQILQENGSLDQQPLIIVLSGSVQEPSISEKERLELLQLELLSSIALDTLPNQLEMTEPYEQYGSAGVKGKYLLQSENVTYTVHSVSLRRSGFYVVGLAIISEAQLPKFEVAAENILTSLQILSDTYDADVATYGLTSEELDQLESDLQAMASIPTATQPISLGETITANTSAGPIAFEFSGGGSTIEVVPSNLAFDPIVDVVDGSGASILSNGPVDEGIAGEPEMIEFQLPDNGVYRIFVRGFGFSSGEFTIELSNP
ncbi:MAG: hypothetical protein AAGD96_07160 [Chloroflexota bacterium]